MTQDNTNPEDLPEYEDWQYEQSMEMAQDWLDDKMMPALIDFDFENDDEDYVPGTAVYGAFCNTAMVLVEVGYTKEELITIIEELFNEETMIPANTILH